MRTANLRRVPRSRHLASACGVAFRQVSLRIERRPKILRHSRLWPIPYLVAGVVAVALLPIPKKDLPWSMLLMAIGFFLLSRAVQVGFAYRRVRPVMNMHGYLSGGGRAEVREFVATLDRRDDPLTLELIAYLNSHARTLAVSDFWGSSHMTPCRELLDPFEVLRRAAMSLRYGASLDQIARLDGHIDSLEVIADAVTRIDGLRRSNRVRAAVVGLPLPASVGVGEGTDIEPVLAWAQAAIALMDTERRMRTEEKIARMVGRVPRERVPIARRVGRWLVAR